MNEYTLNLPEDLAAVARELSIARHDTALLAATISKTATRLVPAADYVSVVVVAKGKIERAGVADDLADTCDTLQSDLGEGPSFDASVNGDTVVINDVSHEKRWPQFMNAAAAVGVRAMMCVPFDAGENKTGTVNMYSSAADVFTGRSRNVGELFTAHAAVAIAAGRESEQLHQAVQGRDVIGQAKGMIMERFSVDADHAFGLLRKLSQDSNVKLSEIAQRLIETGADSAAPETTPGRTSHSNGSNVDLDVKRRSLDGR
ncbi:UNVERIFIED_CONTAM: GAF domain-containing protein [Williamsia faeni]